MSKAYQSKNKFFNRNRIFALILVLIAVVLVLLPKQTNHEGMSPELFVKNALSTERYISTDQLADRMVNQDPTLLLVDTRSKAEFNEFALPNAINIPLQELLNDDLNGSIKQDIYDVVLYSNDHFYADEAWMIGNRLGYQNLYVLKGGLNEWFNTIIDPKYPDETMPKEAFEKYAFRKGAGMYFGVVDNIVEEKVEKIITKKSAVKTEKKPTKKVTPVKKKKKRMPEGGC